jgi:hypothetical protein
VNALSILNIFPSMNDFQEAKMLKAFKALKCIVQRSLSSLRCAFMPSRHARRIPLELVALYRQLTRR